MQKLFFVLFLSFSSVCMHSQGSLEWHTNLTQAAQISMEQKKPLLMFFTGSDWCGWCIRLQKEVFKTDSFYTWANENVILVELDYPRRTPQDEKIKAQNEQIQQMFQIRGYPTVWFVNPEKTPQDKINLSGLGSMGYEAGGSEKWIESANAIIKKVK